jgi:hypothetical protein
MFTTHTHSDPNHPCNGCVSDCVGGWLKLAWGDGEYPCNRPAKYREALKAEEDAHYDRLAEEAHEDNLYERGITAF